MTGGLKKKEVLRDTLKHPAAACCTITHARPRSQFDPELFLCTLSVV